MTSPLMRQSLTLMPLKWLEDSFMSCRGVEKLDPSYILNGSISRSTVREKTTFSSSRSSASGLAAMVKVWGAEIM